MSHCDWLEKICEGYVIEAYNSTTKKRADHISLSTYSDARLESALAEMRGIQPPASSATTPASTASQSGKKRSRLDVDDCGVLSAAALRVPHPYIDASEAKEKGMLEQSAKNYCAFTQCPIAGANKRQKVSEISDQAGRARSAGFCMRCRCGFHPSCYSRAHGLLK